MEAVTDTKKQENIMVLSALEPQDGPQTAIKRSQEDPKTAPKRPRWPVGGPSIVFSLPQLAKHNFKMSQSGCYTAQDGPKRAPRRPNMASHCPKMAPGRQKGGPGRLQNRPKTAARGPNQPQDVPLQKNKRTLRGAARQHYSIHQNGNHTQWHINPRKACANALLQYCKASFWMHC